MSPVARIRMMSDVADKPKVSVPSSTPTSSFSSKPKETGTALAPVAVTEETVGTSAGLVGAGAGIVLLGLGPVVGVVLGLLANYIARSSDNEVGEVARGVGKTALDVYNYLAKINEKYKLDAKVGEATSALYSKVKEADGEDSVLSKLEETVSTTTSKLSDLNEQYDLTGKVKTATGLAVDFTGAAIEKAIELNEKYAIVDKTTEALSTAASKIKEQIKEAQA